MKLPGPDHPITITPSNDHVVVRFGGEIVADTRHALALQEASYPAVLYIPRGDIQSQHFQRTDRSTHCPYKGDASYFTLVAGSERAENAVWTYETPFPAMEQIKEHVAFYPDKVTIERSST
jgi:uncharacterized protein (DUF427 family)